MDSYERALQDVEETTLAAQARGMSEDGVAEVLSWIDYDRSISIDMRDQ